MVLKDGRFGPYVTDGETNASLRKGDAVEEITVERAAELLQERRVKEAAGLVGRKRPPGAGSFDTSSGARPRPPRSNGREEEGVRRSIEDDVEESPRPRRQRRRPRRRQRTAARAAASNVPPERRGEPSTLPAEAHRPGGNDPGRTWPVRTRPQRPHAGLFIVFGGTDGVGKSTQAELLARHSREPCLTRGAGRARRSAGGSPQLLLDRDTVGLTPRSEALLMAADRAQHVADVVRPALDAGPTSSPTVTSTPRSRTGLRPWTAPRGDPAAVAVGGGRSRARPRPAPRRALPAGRRH